MWQAKKQVKSNVRRSIQAQMGLLGELNYGI